MSSRVVSQVRGRAFAVGLPTDVLIEIQAGTLRTRYKGLRLAKNPFDLAIYLRVLETLRPATIVEIGTSEGGSAVWFADQVRALNLTTGIISIDRSPPELAVAGVTFAAGDAEDPEATFPAALLADLPRPLLLIEDSAHTYAATSAVLAWADKLLRPGDMVVIEAGVVADLPGERYAAYEDGPNRAVAEFLDLQGARYAIDEALCDTYGHNVTFCPNAWLRRVAGLDG